MLIYLWLLLTASASSSEIVGYDPARNAREPHLLFLSDGRVARLPAEQIDLLNSLLSTIDSATDKIMAPPLTEAPAYEPTLLPSLNEAKEIFDDLNPYFRRRSECYNRAHVWVYEQYQQRGLNSMKVFLFFTAKYIRDYNYGWWFHVSPYALVNEGGQTRERVLDYAFMEKPTLMKNWTDYFIYPKTECPTVAKYSDYSQHQYESYCYLIKVSMFFWQPMDIEKLEKTGVFKSSFITGEVNAAYRQAF